ncbi:MAG TPA: hypothetical protein VLD39_18665, partial [Gammaproteobacteria bacterium]|nr:hypothetical protein [Gammaproteobacteria bacterium]
MEAAALLGEVLCNAFRPEAAIEALEPVVETEATPVEPAAIAAGAQLARAYLMALRDADAAAMADRVMGPAERCDLIPTIVDLLITRGTALGNLGRTHEAIALLEGGAASARHHDLPTAQMRAANNMGHVLAHHDHVGAMKACRTGMELARRLGDVRFVSQFAWAVSAYLDRDGRFEEAQTLRDEVRDQYELPPGVLLWYELTDLTVRVERGEAAMIHRAFEVARRSIDDANPQSLIAAPATEAKLDLLAGRLAEAHDIAMSVREQHRSLEHLALAAIAAAMLGDVARLEDVEVGLNSSRARGRMAVSIADMVAGALAALRGDTDVAVGRFTAALEFDYLRIDQANLQALFAA